MVYRRHRYQLNIDENKLEQGPDASNMISERLNNQLKTVNPCRSVGPGLKLRNPGVEAVTVCKTTYEMT